jgi:glycosyltransferase involved in cell wall biosynthesis
MRVLYFGTYERAYPRNAQVISCLRGAGVEVVERHEPVWDRQEHKFGAGVGAALRLAAGEIRLRRRGEIDSDSHSQFQAVIVGYPGHFDLGAARRVAGGRPIVFNPLVSLADTLVADRGRFRPGGLPARILVTIDRRAFSAADLVVADTAAQAQLFEAIGARRVEVCFVGAEDRLFTPGWSPPKAFTALFVGKLIPLHGLETILAAARLAPELRVRVIGSGQLGRLLDGRPPNVEHIPWVDYELLPGELHRASCALGIFGTSAKAGRVIPNKAFQALACGTPLVTADTPAIRELLRDEDSALLVPAGDPAAVAGALRRLAADPAHAVAVGTGGLAAYRAHASENVLGRRWRSLLEPLVTT